MGRRIWGGNPIRGTRSLNRPAALNDANQDDDDRQHEQDVDEPAQRIRRHQTEQPQDDENYGDGPKQIHIALLSKVSSCSSPSLEQVETFYRLRRRVSSFAEGAFGGVSDFVYEVLGVAHVLANTADHGLSPIDGVIDSVLGGAAEQFPGVFPRLRSEKQTESSTGTQTDGKC
jgi:hypothetical protein